MTNKDKTIIRQGDVLLVSTDTIENTEVEHTDQHRTVLAHGEVTGHAHAFYDKSATIFKGEKIRQLRLVTEGLLKHEEHSHPVVPKGNYDLPRQTQWTDDNEPIRVAD
jgi:hypothetical protein